jgi:hypothetical protein
MWTTGPVESPETSASSPTEAKSPTSREFDSLDLGFRCLAPGPGWQFRANEVASLGNSDANALRLLGTAMWIEKKGNGEIGVASWSLQRSVNAEHLSRLVKSIEQNGSAPGRLIRGDWTEHHGFPCYVATYAKERSRSTCIYLLAERRLFLIAFEGADSAFRESFGAFQQLVQSFRPHSEASPPPP